MSATVTIDTSGLEAQLRSLRNALGADARFIIKDEGRMLLLQCIKLTAAKTKKIGEASVARTLERVFNPWDISAIKDPKFQKEFRKIKDDQIEATKLFQRITGTHKEVKPFSKEFHRANVSQRGTSRKTNVVTLDVRAFKAYQKETQSHVGRMKAAWLPALAACGGEIKTPFVTRHPLSMVKGTVQNNMDSDSPSMEVRNFARGVGRYAGVVKSAVNIRAKKIKERVRLILSGYSKDVKAGIRARSRDWRAGE